MEGQQGATVAVSGFLHLLLSQVATRLLTFLLNLLSTRSLTPEAYGVAAVQFHLINTSILFISREGFRRGCLRVRQDDPHATRRVLSVAWLTVPVGALLSAAVTAALLHQQAQRKPDAAYSVALVMQGLAAFLELCAEPLYILGSTRLLFGLRVAVETCAAVAKGAVLLVLVRSGRVPPAIAFSWAQLAYAAVVLVGYVLYFAPRALAAWRQRQPQRQVERQGGGSEGGRPHGGAAVHNTSVGQWAPDLQLLCVSGTFTLQAVEKLFLAEGSKMVMAAVQSSRSQGVYGLVSNLGSLVVRTLFQPFEEAAFTAFSKADAGGDAEPSKQQLAAQWRMLALLVRAITAVGLVAAAFGPAYAYLALLAGYTRRWADTEAAAALGLYSLTLPLLAGNGILEAFVHAVAGQAQLQRINLWLVVFSAGHLGASVLAVRAGGASGLIVADAANMVARIAYCLAFVAGRFKGVEGYALRRLLPARATLAALGMAAAATGASRLVLLHDSAGVWRSLASGPGSTRVLPPAALLAAADALPWRVRAGLHILLGAACLAGVAAVGFVHERDVLAEVRRVRGARKAEEKEA